MGCWTNSGSLSLRIMEPTEYGNIYTAYWGKKTRLLAATDNQHKSLGIPGPSPAVQKAKELSISYSLESTRLWQLRSFPILKF